MCTDGKLGILIDKEISKPALFRGNVKREMCLFVCNVKVVYIGAIYRCNVKFQCERTMFTCNM